MYYFTTHCDIWEFICHHHLRTECFLCVILQQYLNCGCEKKNFKGQKDVEMHKHPAGPETVLVKPLVFIKMSVALWRNDDFCIASNPKFWIHFLDVFAFYHSASSFSSDHVTLGILQFFLRRCVSRSPRFSSANWHES